jgi:hypothetical protein
MKDHQPLMTRINCIAPSRLSQAILLPNTGIAQDIRAGARRSAQART